VQTLITLNSEAKWEEQARPIQLTLLKYTQKGIKTGEKIKTHMDASIFIMIVFIAALGFNLYQRFQCPDLPKEHTEIQEREQDMQVNWKYVNGLLAQYEKTIASRQRCTVGRRDIIMRIF
jgi:hypothetical protein